MQHPEIPVGPYCHSLKGGKCEPCPHWDLFPDMPDQDNGWCKLLDNTKEDTHDGFMARHYLWDQLKICGYNREEEEEEYGEIS